MAKLTMQEIARQAGVTRQTVSKILNNKGHMVGRKTREKVLTITRERNYRPNHFATSLKTGKTGLIGISVSGRSTLLFTNPYLAGIFTGVGNILTSHNYKLVFHLLHPTRHGIDQSHELVKSRMVDGMIYILSSVHYHHFLHNDLPYLKTLAMPFVVIHSLDTPLDCPNVGLDTRQAGVRAAEHLLARGHRTVGCVRQDPAIIHAALMYEGYTHALKNHGHAVDPRFVYTAGTGTDAARRLADTIIKEKRPLPEALFITEDTIAEHMIFRFREAGISVPGDLAVVGFGNYRENPLFLPLSTIRQPAREKGKKAAAYLVDALEKPDRSGPRWFYCFTPELVIRQTCGTVAPAQDILTP